MYPNGGTPPEEELAKHGDTSDLGEEGEGTMEEEGEMEGEGIMEEEGEMEGEGIMEEVVEMEATGLKVDMECSGIMVGREKNGRTLSRVLLRELIPNCTIMTEGYTLLKKG